MLDGFRFGFRVATELGRLLLGRVQGNSGVVPRRLDEVDATWLSAVLGARFPGASVNAVRTLSEDSGTTSRRRVAVEYAPGGRPDGAPASVFVKLRPPGLAEELFGRIFDLGPTEVAFYQNARPSLEVRAPELYAARLYRSGAYALVLEDLHGTGAVFKTIADEVSLSEAESVVDALARLHASFWGSAGFPWLRRAGDLRNAAVERFVCRRAHRPTLERFADLLPQSVGMGASVIHAKRPALERYWAAGPLTMIHGDSHVGNAYFVGREVGFFDWQVTQWHQGVRDLAYFLVLSVDIELRRLHERELFERYCERLIEGGARRSDIDSDWLFERYRSFSLYAYMGASVTATMSELQPEALARLGLRRAATAVDDLDALSILRRLP